MTSDVAGRRSRPRETVELIKAVERLVRRIAQRVGDEDVEQLHELVTLRGVLDDAVLKAVTGLRANGMTWESIGAATGTTRQAAILKWASKVR